MLLNGVWCLYGIAVLNYFYMTCSANDDSIVIRRIVAVDALLLVAVFILLEPLNEPR